MLHSINQCQNTSLKEFTRMEPPFLPFDEPNLCNNCIFIDQNYDDRLYFFKQVDSNTDLLDNVLLIKSLYDQPKTKEFRPTQIEI